MSLDLIPHSSLAQQHKFYKNFILHWIELNVKENMTKFLLKNTNMVGINNFLKDHFKFSSR